MTNCPFSGCKEFTGILEATKELIRLGAIPTIFVDKLIVTRKFIKNINKTCCPYSNGKGDPGDLLKISRDKKGRAWVNLFDKEMW